MKSVDSFRNFVVTLIAGLFIGYVRNVAAAVDLGFNQVFSDGSVAPASSKTPWMSAVFTDNGNGTVDLSLSNPNLTGVESVSELFFNFASCQVSVQSLSFSTVSQSGSFTAPILAEKNNGFKADGVGGFYDFTINFAPGSNTAKTFGVGDTLVLKISSTQGPIDAADFESLSEGGQLSFYAAAHVQNTPNEAGVGSAWIGANILDAVPAPLPEAPIGFAAGLSALGVAAVSVCCRKA